MRFVFFVMVGLVGVRYHLVLREMERLIVEQGEGRQGAAITAFTGVFTMEEI